MDKCLVETCDREQYSRQYCRTHYRRLIRTGYVRADEPLREYVVKEIRYCKLETCVDKHYAKGYCEFHYDRDRTGVPLDAPRPKPRAARGQRTICEVGDCDRPVASGPYCFAHHQRVERGVPVDDRPIDIRIKSEEERFAHYTQRDEKTGCLLWTGAKHNGYGSITRGPGKKGGVPAHRVAYERATGEKLKSYEAIHHICAVRNCVEPSHLQKVSTVENGVEMLERNWYLKRISDLEAALLEFDPGHPLLVVEDAS